MTGAYPNTVWSGNSANLINLRSLFSLGLITLTANPGINQNLHGWTGFGLDFIELTTIRKSPIPGDEIMLTGMTVHHITQFVLPY